MQFECSEKHILSGISNYFRLFLTDALTPPEYTITNRGTEKKFDLTFGDIFLDFSNYLTTKQKKNPIFVLKSNIDMDVTAGGREISSPG